MSINNIIFGDVIRCYSKNKKEVLYNSDYSYLKLTQNWKYNRQTDPERIKEIVKDITIYNKIEGIIYLAKIIENGETTYQCFDGNHRREAVIQFNQERISSGKCALNIPILINVITEVSHEEIKIYFNRLNKSIPLPELYIDDIDNNALKGKLLTVIQMINKKWSTHKTITRRPAKPNYNSDLLLDILYNIKNINNKTSQEIYDRLIEMNNERSKKIYKKISENILNKCIANNCYLFLEDITEDFEKKDDLIIFDDEITDSQVEITENSIGNSIGNSTEIKKSRNKKNKSRNKKIK